MSMTRYRSCAETAEEVAILAGRGWGLERISCSLHMQPGSVVRALYRHRARLDDPAELAALDQLLVPLNREREAVRWAARTEDERAARAVGKRAWWHRQKRRGTAA